MKIACIAHREGGSKVDIDGIEYHFEPLADGAHVADVEDPKHQDRFLSIGEGYKLYRGDLAPVGKPTKLTLPVVNDTADLRHQDSTVAHALYGSSVHDSFYEIGSQTYQLGDVVSKAFDKSGLSAEDWNDLDEADRHAKIDIALDDLAEAAEQEPVVEGVDERATLAEAYKAKFGKAPHYKASIATITAALAE